jgi:hypothetical protein
MCYSSIGDIKNDHSIIKSVRSQPW